MRLLVERFATPVVLLLVAAVGWCWLYVTGRDMYGPMSGWSAWMMRSEWTPGHAALMLAMWIAMMTAMMLPSALPAVLSYERIIRAGSGGHARSRVLLFVAGYLLAWSGFSLVATLTQWWLADALLLSPMMVSASRTLSGSLLLLAGVYQWTALKQRCLTRCRSPLDHLGQHWRPGRIGALRMGLMHGVACVACCWALMALLFVGGVMSVGWIVMLSLYVLVEKTVPLRGLHRAIGALLALAGVLVLLGLPA